MINNEEAMQEIDREVTEFNEVIDGLFGEDFSVIVEACSNRIDEDRDDAVDLLAGVTSALASVAQALGFSAVDLIRFGSHRDYAKALAAEATQKNMVAGQFAGVILDLAEEILGIKIDHDTTGVTEDGLAELLFCGLDDPSPFGMRDAILAKFAELSSEAPAA